MGERRLGGLMRLAIAGVLMLALAAALLVGSPPATTGEASDAPVSTSTLPAEPYGAPIGGGAAPPTEVTPSPTENELPTSTLPATDGSSSTTTSAPLPAAPTTTVVDPDQVGEGTTLIDDETGHVHEGGSHSEEEPDDEFPDLGEGEFPISSNLPEGTDYPLAAMVQLAVDVLIAETTGEGRDQYPHLADQVAVCCEDFEVDGAVVLFGAAQADPATIIVEWHADAAGAETRVVRGSTQTRWWWIDNTWLGEFELPEGVGS